MRISTSALGTVIDEDQDVVQRVGDIDIYAAYWQYPVIDTHGNPVLDESGNPVVKRLDIRSLRPNMDVLSGLYMKAQGSKNPYDAAAYCQHKARIIAMFNANQAGNRYEPAFTYTAGVIV